MANTLTANTFDQLTSQISGELLRPGDALYEQTRRGWNLTVDQHPALILIANDVQDVMAGVRFANAHNLGVGVQLTGHGAKYAADDNMLIVTSRLKGVSLNTEAHTARVEGGAIWQDVLDVTTPHGLAPLLGTSPHVGVVGYTLGGGIGWLARHYGLAADSVLSIDLVTPDGELRHTSASENSDLFWASLGGGGNFGVVTAIEFKLYPVAALYGGILTYPGALAGDALRFYRQWLKSAPNELTTHFVIMKYPELPQLPDTIRGKMFVLVRAAHEGDAAEGERLMRPWLEWQTPLENSFRQLPFAEVATISNDPVAPTPSYTTNDMLTELSDEAIDIIVRRASDSKSPVVFNELRHVGGAVARADANANAIGNRDAAFYFTLGGIVFNPELRTALESYMREYKEELRPYLHGGIYLNFAAANEARARAKDAYSPQSYARLVALKQKVDPKNLFRYSYQLVTAN